MYRVMVKLKNIRSKLCTWNNYEVGDIFNAANRLSKQLEISQRALDLNPTNQEFQINLK